MKKRTQPRIWNTETYNKLSGFYDTFMKFIFPIGERGREKVVNKLTFGTVLDVACGTGTLLAMASSKGLKCYGLDLSDGMLFHAKIKTPDAELTQASFYKIPYHQQSFDYVIATNALSGEFIDTEKVLKEMIRVCKNGGSIYLAEWPKAEKDTFLERLVVWFARLTDDAPKDYLGLFRKLSYEPTVDVINERYHVIGIKKVDS